MCVAVRKSNAEMEAMKRQAKGLAQEYDRLLTEHQQLQVKRTDAFNSHKILTEGDNNPNLDVILFLFLY